jgi:FMN phosphatase YigB (HAD superfamily)
LIIFDLDDTLIDTSGSLTPERYKQIVKHMKCEQEYERCLKEDQMASSSREVVTSMAHRCRWTDQMREEALSFLKAPIPGHLTVSLTPHAMDVLQDLQKHNHTMTLVTLGHHNLQLSKLEKAGVDRSLFSTIEVLLGVDKRGAYREILARHASSEEEVWVCGDHVERDLLPAKLLGLCTAHIKWGRGRRVATPNWVDLSVSNLLEWKEKVL